MPIIVKDFTWTQTSKTLHIKIPLTSGIKENLDIFTTDSYVKIHFNPFLFEIFLLHDVDNDKSKCLVQTDQVILDLLKKDECDWECLEKKLDKGEKMKIREEIHEKCQERAKRNAEERNIKKSQLDRFTVQQAMEIDTKQHNLMDSRRDNQRKMAMEALEDWRLNNTETVATVTVKDKLYNQEIEKNMSGVKIVELPSTEDEIDHKNITTKCSAEVTTEKKLQSYPKKPIKTPVRSEYIDKKKREAAKRILPKLRETGELEITHTPRTFPTPSRESTANEEETWLKNITQARRATGFISEDLRPEEQDPQWCKDKGDQFFRAGNFLGAISAYSHGITLSDKLPSLFANRAATHFALGNFNKCLTDCSTALDLMRPACEGNRFSRAKCIARRAAALVRLGYLSKAIDEMKAAAKLLPEDEKIKKDLYDMERAWEQNPDSD
ncbi:dynein axonemal assembly factor 4-like [Achroia grisella]|uniref:dynein axonemal assembly factor 4-like n=1 Tax=Achroia grisella TaxID=688607 RepID=UPI0027D32C9E|nr:dynein axonemal assembly factor 4-like [Achroia grisella]